MKLPSTKKYWRRKSGFSLSELAIATLIIAVMIILSFAVMKSVREAGWQTGCVANMRTLYRALMQYTQDHGGVLPPVYDRDAPLATRVWVAKLKANYGIEYYSRTSSQKSDTYCPSTSATKSNPYNRDAVDYRSDYSVNANITSSTLSKSQRHLSAISFDKVLLFEDAGSSRSGSKPLDTYFRKRHNGRFNALFMDGHVESLQHGSELEGRWTR